MSGPPLPPVSSGLPGQGTPANGGLTANPAGAPLSSGHPSAGGTSLAPSRQAQQLPNAAQQLPNSIQQQSQATPVVAGHAPLPSQQQQRANPGALQMPVSSTANAPTAGALARPAMPAVSQSVAGLPSAGTGPLTQTQPGALRQAPPAAGVGVPPGQPVRYGLPGAPQPGQITQSQSQAQAAAVHAKKEGSGSLRDLANRFSSDQTPAEQKLKAISDLRDNIEIAFTQDYSRLLTLFMHPFITYLQREPHRDRISDDTDQKIRVSIVDILSRFPLTEVFKQYARDTCKILIVLLDQDNEEIGCLVIRWISNLLRHFKEILVEYVPKLIEFISKLYRNFPSIVQNTLGRESMVTNAQEHAQFLRKSESSFQVMKDCPSLVMTLLSTFPQIQSDPSLTRLLQYMFEAFSAETPPTVMQVANHPKRMQSLVHEMLFAKVKLLNFITLLLRNQSDSLRQFYSKIPRSIVSMIISCPHEAASIRKELLIATRHVLTVKDMMGEFAKHVDTFLEEKHLVGENRGPGDFLRQLGYFLMAEVVFHVRSSMSIKQLQVAYKIFANNIHDPSLPCTVQTTSSRLLMNLLEGLSGGNSGQAATDVTTRAFLIRILDTLARKFGSLQDYIRLLAEMKKQRQKSDNSDAEGEMDSEMKAKLDLLRKTATAETVVSARSTPMEGDVKPTPGGSITPAAGGSTPANASSGADDREGIYYNTEALEEIRSVVKFLPHRLSLVNEWQFDLDKELKECGSLLKTLTVAVRTVAWSVSQQNSSNKTIEQGSPTAHAVHEEEVRICGRIFKHGLKCLSLIQGSSEEKESLDLFASVFSILDADTFRDVFSVHMETLFDCIIENETMICIPQHYLAAVKLSKMFADILLHFLTSNMKWMHTVGDRANVMLKLFKVGIGAVTLFPENEAVLRPHFTSIVQHCLRAASENQNPSVHLNVIKSLFKSITQNKNDVLLKEFVPMIKSVLDVLLRMLHSSQHKQHTESIVELCLLIPARSNFFLPHMHLLNRPLILALKGNSELAKAGLQKLENWVDTLQPHFLDSLLQPVTGELMPAIYMHLHPNPVGPASLLSLTAIKILGKLGGRNRRLVKDGFQCPEPEMLVGGVQLWLNWVNANNSINVKVPLTFFVEMAHSVLVSKNADKVYVQAASKFCRSLIPVLLPVLNNFQVTAMSATQVQNESFDEALKKAHSHLFDEEAPGPSKVLTDRDLYNTRLSALRKALLCLIINSKVNSDDQGVQEDMVGLNRFFALQSVAVIESSGSDEGSAASACFGLWVEVLTESMSLLQPSVTDEAITLLKDLVSRVCKLTDDGDMSEIMHLIANPLSFLCHEKDLTKKIAASKSIAAVAEVVSAKSLRQSQDMLCRSLLFVGKDVGISFDSKSSNVSGTLDAFLAVVKTCNIVDGKLDKSWSSVLQILAKELTSNSANVRLQVQQVLATVSEMTSMSYEKLLEPAKSQLLEDLFSGKLSSCALQKQIGLIDALTFLIKNAIDILPSLDGSFREFLVDTLYIANVDDEYINKQRDARAIAQMNSLRTACVSLLCSAINSKLDVFGDASKSSTKPATPTDAMETDGAAAPSPAAQAPEIAVSGEPSQSAVVNAVEETSMQESAIRLFFRVLRTGPNDAIGYARSGVQGILARHPNSQEESFKKMMQDALRPMLYELRDSKNISLPLLQGLHRHLELLHSWFNAALGTKLYEYLDDWLKPDNIAFRQSRGDGAESPVIPSELVRVFHLLSPKEEDLVNFTEKLVYVTMKLQNALTPTAQFSFVRSPYKQPLALFFNKYPQTATEFFFSKITDQALFRLFLDCLKLPECKDLRQYLCTKADLIKDTTLAAANARQSGQQQQQITLLLAIKAYHGVSIIRELVKENPLWLSENNELFIEMLRLWVSEGFRLRRDNESEGPLWHLKEVSKLLKCFVTYIRARPEDYKIVFSVLAALGKRSVVDMTFLRRFFCEEYPSLLSMQQKQNLVDEFLKLFNSHPTHPAETRLYALTHVIQPMFIQTLPEDHDRSLLGGDRCKNLVQVLFATGSSAAQQRDKHPETLRVELLQLATLMIRLVPGLLLHSRKEIINFGWYHLKFEDSMSMLWGYVNVARFMEAFKAPSNLVLQVYVKLLRMFQPDNRSLQKYALDILTPVLPRRLVSNTPDPRHVVWIRYTKKIIVEESHSLQHLLQILQFLVRHPKLFYPYRAQFASHIVQSVSRISNAPTLHHDQRSVALDLAELVVKWDTWAHEDSKKKAIAMMPAEAAGSQPNLAGAAASVPASTPIVQSAGIRRQREDDAAPDLLMKKIKTETGSVPVSVPPTSVASFAPTPLHAVASVTPASMPVSGPSGPPTAISSVQFAQQVAPSSVSLPVSAVPSSAGAAGIPRPVAVSTTASASLPTAAPITSHSTAAAAPTLPMSSVLLPPTSVAATAKPVNSVAPISSASTAVSAPKAAPNPPFVPGAPPSSTPSGVPRPISVPISTASTSLPASLPVSSSISSAPVHPPTTVTSQPGPGTVQVAGVPTTVGGPSVRPIAGTPQAMPVQAGVTQPTGSLVPTTGSYSAPAGAAAARAPNTSQIPGLQPGKPEEKSWLSQAMVDVIVNFLIRFALVASENDRAASIFPTRCMRILEDCLKIWPRVKVKYQYFEKLMAAHAHNLSSSLKIMHSLWINNHHSAFYEGLHVCLKILSSTIQHNDARVADSLKLLLDSCISKLKVSEGPANAQLDAFLTKCREVAQKGMESSDRNERERVEVRPMVLNGLRILKAVTAVQPNQMDSHLQQLYKLFNKYTKDHMQMLQQYSASRVGRDASQIDRSQIELTSKILITCIELATVKLPNTTDARKSFFHNIQTLLERSSDAAILSSITAAMSVWVSRTTPNDIMTKDLSMLIIRMTALEQLKDRKPFEHYLDLMFKVHTRRMACDQEIINKTERAFVIGLRSNDYEVRRKYFEEIHNRLPLNVAERLRGIFSDLDWEAVGDCFWLEHALDLMLRTCDQQGKAHSLTPFSQEFEVDSVFSFAKKSERGAVKDEVESVKLWMKSACNMPSKDVYSSICGLVHFNPPLCKGVWVSMFKGVWSCLASTQRFSMVKPIKELLGRDFHIKQQMQNPNVIQTIVDGCYQSHPRPGLPTSMIAYIGRMFNVWHTCINYLESRLKSASAGKVDGEVFVAPSSAAELTRESIDGLTSLYKTLEESDMHFALVTQNSRMPQTEIGLSCMQHHYFPEAQGVFYSLINEEHSLQVTAQERALWDEMWVSSVREQNQWDMLSDLSSTTQSYDLMLECAWRQNDFAAMKNLLQFANFGDPHQTKVYEVYNHLKNASVIEGMKGTNEAIQSVIRKWCILPEVSQLARVPCLQKLHQLVELEESCKILEEVGKAVRTNQPPDTKIRMQAWRARLPNTWDDISVWNDLLKWRMVVFQMFVDAPIHNTDMKSAMTFLGDHEKTWSLLKLSEAARKQGLVETSLHSLGQVPRRSPIDVASAFFMVREELLSKMHSGKKGRLLALGKLGRVDLDKLQPRQRAELLRLKGELFKMDGNSAAAEEMFATATSLSEMKSSECWASWGKFFDDKLQQAVIVNPERAAVVKNVIVCYIEAAKLGSNNARMLVPRILWLLQKEVTVDEAGEAFMQAAESLPSWVWLFWLPQLFRSIERERRSYFRGVFKRVVSDYPQASYCILRRLNNAYLPNAADAASASAVKDSIAEISLDAMNFVREKHQAIVMETDAFVSCLVDSFMPTLEQQMQAVLKTNLDDVGMCDASKKVPEFELQNLIKSIAGLLDASTFKSHPSFDKFESKYGKQLAKDYSSESLSQLRTAKDVFALLAGWIAVLDKAMPDETQIPLSQLNAGLLDIKGSQMELPGQYLSPYEPSPEQHLRIDRISPEISRISRPDATAVRIRIRCSDGTKRVFAVLTSLGPMARCDEKFSQISQLLNKSLSKHKPSRRRGLQLRIPSVFSLTSQCQMISQVPGNCSLDSVLGDQLERMHSSSNRLALQHMEMVVSGKFSTQEAFSKMQELVPSTTLRHTLERRVSSTSHQWALRKRISQQHGMVSLLSAALTSAAPAPNRLQLSCEAGDVFVSGVRPSLLPDGDLKSSLAVPVRLTPNLQRLFGDVMIGGPMLSSMVCSSHAVCHPKSSMYDLICHLMEAEMSIMANKLKQKALPLKRAEEAAAKVISNFKQWSPPDFTDMPPADKEEILKRPVHWNLKQVLDKSKAAAQLSNMPSHWHAWM